MPRPPKELRSADAVAARGAKQLERALTRYFLRRAQREVTEEIRALTPGKLKRVKKAKLDPELVKILTKFALVQAKEAGVRAANTTEGIETVIDPKLLEQRLKSKGFKIKLINQVKGWVEQSAMSIDKETRRLLKEQIRKILIESSNEVPRPSMGEVARRIRLGVIGKDPDGRAYGFSQQRAATIARTEIRQAETIGRMETFEAAGVEKLEWVAHTDGRSKNRHHERMNQHKPVKVGDWFTTPLGTKMRFPMDPKAKGPNKVKDTINCRCHVVAVID